MLEGLIVDEYDEDELFADGNTMEGLINDIGGGLPYKPSGLIEEA